MTRIDHAPNGAGGAIRPSEIEAFLHRIAIGGAGLRLRDEDRKKARELAGLLPEIARALQSAEAPRIVDAAAGSGWVGLAAIALLGRTLGRPVSVCAIEHDARRAERIRTLATDAAISGIEVRARDVGDDDAWPDAPDLVVALHACGDASDRVIAQAARVRAKSVLVVPCCVASKLPLSAIAIRRAEQLGLARAGVVRRRFVEAFVLGARLLALEAAGYGTEVVTFTTEAVTPYNALLRGRRLRDATRAERAKDELARLVG